jgi:hypothetical protein
MLTLIEPVLLVFRAQGAKACTGTLAVTGKEPCLDWQIVASENANDLNGLYIQPYKPF